MGCSSQDPYEQEEISATQLQDKLDDQEDFILLVERDGCTYCEKLNEYIEETKDEHDGIKVYLLDSTDFDFDADSEDEDKLVSNTDDGNILLNMAPYFKYTPAIYVIDDGQVKTTGIGFSDTNGTISIWDNESLIDFNQAESEDFWDFIESNS